MPGVEEGTRSEVQGLMCAEAYPQQALGKDGHCEALIFQNLAHPPT